VRIFFRNRQITKPPPRLVQEYPISEWENLSRAFERMFDQLGEVKVTESSLEFTSFASDVATGISLTREGAMLANMPLHGIDSKFDRVVIDKPMESMRILGSNLDYTYRVPPAILRRRRKFKGLRSLWPLR